MKMNVFLQSYFVKKIEKEEEIRNKKKTFKSLIKFFSNSLFQAESKHKAKKNKKKNKKGRKNSPAQKKIESPPVEAEV